ncbi:hypothetical protein ACOME3_003011 [Neoechinorhynchus agilis]
MDKDDLAKLVPINYIERSEDALRQRFSPIRQLLSTRKLPIEGFDKVTIDYLVSLLSQMDSNNYLNIAGVGDLYDAQPKACGSSILAALTNRLVVDALQVSGYKQAHDAFVVPMATGMTLNFCLQYLRKSAINDGRSDANVVLWPRIDQKSCIIE